MDNLNEIREQRKAKLASLRNEGVNPYPVSVKRTHTIEEALNDFSDLSKKEKEIFIVGRIRAVRWHGGSTFFDVEDGNAKMQAFLRQDHVGDGKYKEFLGIFDVGDFIEVRGTLFKTKQDEKTILINSFKMLSKSILPLPEKWHGLQDVEERFRKRYVDLIFNKEAKEKIIIRSEIIREIRKFLNKKGFMEVETPILQLIYGGAKACPFTTHLNVLDLDLYLRIAPELFLKELLVGGYEKVFEIGRVFRNEGADRFHNPDFTSCEFYWAYADYKQLMKLCEELFAHILKNVFGKMQIEYQGKVIDFTPPFKRIDFYDLLKKDAGIDLEEVNEDSLRKAAEKMDIKIDPGEGFAEMADKIYKKCSRPNIWEPTFIIHHPYGAFPLAKPNADNPKKLANFQLVIAGWELVNAFSELNDAQEQRKRFEEQEGMFNAGYTEAQRIDKNFLEALEYGMPPAAGYGMGVDRLAALLTNSHSIREVILFPMMRPKE